MSPEIRASRDRSRFVKAGLIGERELPDKRGGEST